MKNQETLSEKSMTSEEEYITPETVWKEICKLYIKFTDELGKKIYEFDRMMKSNNSSQQ